MKPQFSICMCNYNMEETIEVAIRSICDQIDDNFEIIVVDDGSNDSSQDIIRSLRSEFKNIRGIFLKRDRKRFLGETRNIAARHARGSYLIHHVDADDEWSKSIQMLTEVYIRICKAIGKEVWLAGNQFQICPRRLFEENGGYENVRAFEDRLMWMKLSAKKEIIFLSHNPVRKRLRIKSSVSVRKAISYQYWALMIELASGSISRPGMVVKYVYDAVARRENMYLGRKGRVLRAFVACFAITRRRLKLRDGEVDKENFASRREDLTKTIMDLQEMYSVDMSDLYGEDYSRIFGVEYN